jgi:hypothetical protein
VNRPGLFLLGQPAIASPQALGRPSRLLQINLVNAEMALAAIRSASDVTVV